MTIDPLCAGGVRAVPAHSALLTFDLEDVAGGAIEELTNLRQIVKGNVFDCVVEQALYSAPTRPATLNDSEDTDPAMFARFFERNYGFEMTIHDFHTSI